MIPRAPSSCCMPENYTTLQNTAMQYDALQHSAFSHSSHIAFKCNAAHCTTLHYTAKQRHDRGFAVNVCDHIHEACAEETWRGGSLSTSMTVYTKNTHMRFNLKKRWVLFKHLEHKEETASKKLLFIKELSSKSANCSRTLPKTGLALYGAVARRSAHELSHD